MDRGPLRSPDLPERSSFVKTLPVVEIFRHQLPQLNAHQKFGQPGDALIEAKKVPLHDRQRVREIVQTDLAVVVRHIRSNIERVELHNHTLHIRYFRRTSSWG